MDNKQNHSFYYRKELYIITAKTNMHVGSGEESYGLVDNQVQRDVLSRLPNINASGLKGALREHFSHVWGNNSERITEIFGSDSFVKSEMHRAGKFRFFNGSLLSLPVRSNVRPFFRAVSPEVIKELMGNLEAFGYDDEFKLKESLEQLSKLEPVEKQPLIFSRDEGAVLEEFRFKAVTADKNKFDYSLLKKIEVITGAPLALMHDSDFKDMCSNFNLPLIARNHLENGRSQNLWHEQVVPRETKFYFLLLKPGNCNYDLEFSPGEPVQIGANASIGYGFCQVLAAADLLAGAIPVENRS